MRKATIRRTTKETDIALTLALDGEGQVQLDTGIGFFNHMLSSIARFAMIDLDVACQGDLEVDGHHTVEDIGICLGQALREALGDKKGITRLGHAYVPMDEALAFAALDISARPYLAWDAAFPTQMVGAFDTQLVCELFRAVATHAGLTLHLRVLSGSNSHHMIEALCKAFGKALDAAKQQDARITDVLSTKGAL